MKLRVKGVDEKEHGGATDLGRAAELCGVRGMWLAWPLDLASTATLVLYLDPKWLSYSRWPVSPVISAVISAVIVRVVGGWRASRRASISSLPVLLGVAYPDEGMLVLLLLPHAELDPVVQ